MCAAVEAFICEMLAQHVRILAGHLCNKSLMGINVEDLLCHKRAVTRRTEQKSHMQLGRLYAAVFSVGEINEFVSHLQEGCGVEVSFRIRGAALLSAHVVRLPPDRVLQLIKCSVGAEWMHPIPARRKHKNGVKHVA